MTRTTRRSPGGRWQCPLGAHVRAWHRKHAVFASQQAFQVRDKSQTATAMLAIKFDFPWVIDKGTTLGMNIVSLTAVWPGARVLDELQVPCAADHRGRAWATRGDRDGAIRQSSARTHQNA